jgi:hypothetical protein
MLYMLPETLSIYQKYSYFLHILSDERFLLFRKNRNEIDCDSFFDYYNFVIYKHIQLKPLYRNFRANRAQIMKKFNHGKYYILLRSRFCSDLCFYIITFIV